MQVREFADFRLRPRLLSIPGVAQVIPIGGAKRPVSVEPDSAAMARLGVNLSQLEDAFARFAGNASGGFRAARPRIPDSPYCQTLALSDLENLAVAERNGQPVLLRQLAQVKFVAAAKRGDAGYNGKPAVVVSVQNNRQADSPAHRRHRSRAGQPEPTPAGGCQAPQVSFHQADFIQASVATVPKRCATAPSWWR